MKFTLAILLFVAFIPISIAVICIPFWTRKTESFGVTIPEEVYHHPSIRKLRKSYVVITSLFSLFISIIFIYATYTGNELTTGIVFPLLIVLYMVASMFLYIPYHQRMRDWKDNYPKWHANPNVITINTRFRQQRIVYSNKWFILPLMIALITMVLTLIAYPHLPDNIPIQYNFQGDIIKTADKTYSSALLLPIIQFYLVLLFLFINTVIRKAKQSFNPENPDSSMQRQIIFRRKWSKFTIVNGTAIVSLLALYQLNLFLTIAQSILTAITIVFSISIILWALLLSFKIGQGGSRLNADDNGSNGTEQTIHDNDNYWKFGLFYVNKNDPALFLEKRVGIGWTTNVAHPISWLMMISIFLLAFLIPYFLLR